MEWAGAVGLRPIPTHDDEAVMNGAPGGSNGKGRSRFPSGMTERKARARTTATATATAKANAGLSTSLRYGRDDNVWMARYG